MFKKKQACSIPEAKRYLQNARQILSEKAKKDGDYYDDEKYVKIAGGIVEWAAGQENTRKQSI